MKTVQVKIREHKLVERMIDIVLPYYYKHEIYLDDYTHHIYGKIDGNITTTIQEGIYTNDRTTFEVEKENWSGDGCYITDEHKSNELEYNKAKERLETFFNCL